SYPVQARGGGSSVGRAPGCGPGGRGIEYPPPPLESQRRKLGGGSIRRPMSSDQRVHEILLHADEVDAVALEHLGARADRAQGLALVDEAADLLAERLDRWQLDDGGVHSRVLD